GMQTDAAIIVPSYTERIEQGTRFYKMDNGACFYWCFLRDCPHRLYAKWEGQEIDATLPGNIESIAMFKNTLYFSSSDMAFKVLFTAPDSIRLAYIRDKGESRDLGALGSKQLEEEIAARVLLHDDDDDVANDFTDEELADMKCATGHKGMTVRLKKFIICLSRGRTK
ncbi:hypothetical protein PMAYCL1PPCAC_03743, partial [Pristionchus mayeri]